MRGLSRLVVHGLTLAVACACTSVSPTPAPTPAANPTPTPARTPGAAPTATLPPTPAPSVMSFPDLSEVELAPGRYDSSPPFDFNFSFDIPSRGWSSAHLHGEFFDVMRFENPADQRDPTHWIAWAHPTTVFGSGVQPAGAMTPMEAATSISNVENVDATAIVPFQFAGRDGVQIDLTADLPNTHIFGGADGNFGLEPSHPLRLGIVNVDAELLFVMCLGLPDELDEACAEAQPILDSVHEVAP